MVADFEGAWPRLWVTASGEAAAARSCLTLGATSPEA